MEVKTKIHNDSLNGENLPYYREGQIFWMSIGENIGFEEDGRGELFIRPVIVLSGYTKRLFFGAPLTTTVRKGHYFINIICNNKSATILLNQARPFDTARIIKSTPLDSIGGNEFYKIKKLFIDNFMHREMIDPVKNFPHPSPGEV